MPTRSGAWVVLAALLAPRSRQAWATAAAGAGASAEEACEKDPDPDASALMQHRRELLKFEAASDAPQGAPRADAPNPNAAEPNGIPQDVFEEHATMSESRSEEGGTGVAQSGGSRPPSSAPLLRNSSKPKTASIEVPGQRNLVLLFDGTSGEPRAECTVPDGWICETSILRMRYLLVNDDRAQVVRYVVGVGAGAVGEGDMDVIFGYSAIYRQGEEAYRWLVDHYREGDHLFIFGFSRGCIAARWVQGILHRVGLAKSLSDVGAFIKEHERAGEPRGENLGPRWEGVEVKFMGLMDSVLRTLLRPTLSRRDIENMHLKLTSTVKSLAHAIALSDIRETFQSNEMLADPATDAEQVWFAGTHAVIGGQVPNGTQGASNIVLGWLLDRAEAKGVLLRPGWSALGELYVDFMGGLSNQLSLRDLPMIRRYLEVRHPFRCRAEAGRAGQPVKIHQSVQDRMAANSGYAPTPWCCQRTKAGIDSFGIQWVTNEHYNLRKPVGPTRRPQWLKVTVRRLANADWAEAFGRLNYPEYYLRIFNYHTNNTVYNDNWVPLKGMSAYPYVHQRIDQQEAVALEWVASPHRRRRRATQPTGSVDFGGQSVIVPYDGMFADMVRVEVSDDDTARIDTWVGHVELRYRDKSSFEMHARPLHEYQGGVGTLEVQLERIFSDAEAAGEMGGPEPAECQWAGQHIAREFGYTMKDMCVGDTAGWFSDAIGGNADNCEDFIEDLTSGA